MAFVKVMLIWSIAGITVARFGVPHEDAKTQVCEQTLNISSADVSSKKTAPKQANQKATIIDINDDGDDRDNKAEATSEAKEAELGKLLSSTA